MACNEQQADPFMASADAVLVVDPGDESPTELAVHSLFLEQKSKVLGEAIRIARKDYTRGDKMHVPLPAVSVETAQLFVSFVYTQLAEGFAYELKQEELWSLVQVCHAYDCQQLLSVLDKALVKHLGPRSPWSPLRPLTAVKTLEQAHALGLPDFEAACGYYLGKNAQAVLDAGPPGGSVGGLLRFAADTIASVKSCRDRLEDMEDAIDRAEQARLKTSHFECFWSNLSIMKRAINSVINNEKI